jgi:dTDP-4-dehydrorhamnose reductase
MMQTNTGLELWAGIECTINRVGNQYHQQLERSGHTDRLDDLDKFASLGIKAIRYPVLWEQIAPDRLEDADWSWTDERLDRLRTLGILPIVGFVHHGSGPMHTSLIDPEFPSKLAAYAAAFAERYPWIKYYTPVNEPLTTARFSGLYGHWYPHGRDNNTFATALINQCKAIVLSMQAIRKKIPEAKLVQTEDLCKVHSTPLLAYQADFENERRWLSFDLLCGKLKKGYPMWDTLLTYGVNKETLHWFNNNACPPDIFGINHYVTSNRFLDEELDLYPRHSHGGNAFHRYADVEAVRVPDIAPSSLYTLLKEVWTRYRLPIAVTEVHLGGYREEQLRWLKECWETAQQLRREHIDIRAITAWSLLGSFDWNSLVTRNDNYYESGVFDVRGNTIRPTALSVMMRALAHNTTLEHPVLSMPGFWKREDRFYAQHQRCRSMELVLSGDDSGMGDSIEHVIDITLCDIAPILVIGSDNDLASCFTTSCTSRAIHYIAISCQDVDMTNATAVQKMVEQYKPWAIINTGEFSRIMYEDEPDVSPGMNVPAMANLARICQQSDIQLLTFLPEEGLDGKAVVPCSKNGEACPGATTGCCKTVAEKNVLAIMPKSLIVRTSRLPDTSDKQRFVTDVIRKSSNGKGAPVSGNIHISVSGIPDLVSVCIDLLIDKEHGIWCWTKDGVLLNS